MNGLVAVICSETVFLVGALAVEKESMQVELVVSKFAIAVLL